MVIYQRCPIRLRHGNGGDEGEPRSNCDIIGRHVDALKSETNLSGRDSKVRTKMSFGSDEVLLPFSDLEIRASTRLEIDGDECFLVGVGCQECGALAFPCRQVCPECMSSDVVGARLANRGILYSFTTVHVSAGRPTPYTIGYVDLDDGVRVLCEIDVASGEPRIGQRMRIVSGLEGSWKCRGEED